MKRILAVLGVMFLSLTWALPVHAQTVQPQPDSMSVLSVRAFTDLVETGDVSIVFRWSVDYGDDYTAANYTALNPASLAIIFQMYDPTGATLLSTATPYVYGPFATNGYNQGVSSFYFTAADLLPEGLGYLIRITQSPVYFTTPVSTTYTMTGNDWTNSTEGDMYDHVMQLCDYLLAEYPTVTLKTSTDVGLVFSTYGESYFRAAVPGIQALCPALFYVQDYIPTEMTVTPYDSTLQDQYSIRMQGSEVKRGADRLMAHFGLTGYFGLGMGILVACIGCGIYSSRKGWGLEPGLIGASLVAIGGALLIGNAVFTIVMIGTLIAVIAIMFSYFGRRA
jgi:hypothetical protein